jgi:myo-inositol-1(or 4)-monophosphatase
VDRDLAAACDLATELAVAAGRLQVERRGTVVIGTKAHANDLVSDVDLASEKLIVDGVTAAWPGDGILAEEGSDAPGTSGWRWVIDPLDGTRNYLTGAGPW